MNEPTRGHIVLTVGAALEPLADKGTKWSPDRWMGPLVQGTLLGVPVPASEAPHPPGAGSQDPRLLLPKQLGLFNFNTLVRKVMGKFFLYHFKVLEMEATGGVPHKG